MIDCCLRSTYHDVSIASVSSPRRHLSVFRLSSATDRGRAETRAIVENIKDCEV